MKKIKSMEPIKKRKLPAQLMQIANKIAYESKYTSSLAFGAETAIYSKTDDSYICSEWMDLRSFIAEGITELIQARKNGGKVAQIGFNPTKRKWYGWSHRAGMGFGIGYRIKRGSPILSSGWTKDAPEYKSDMKKRSKYKVGYTTKTLKECKELAILFADSVS